MDGMDFVRKVSTTTAKVKQRVCITLISVGTEREARGLSRENVPRPENAHDGFYIIDFFLLFLFPLAIFDSPEISL